MSERTHLKFVTNKISGERILLEETQFKKSRRGTVQSRRGERCIIDLHFIHGHQLGFFVLGGTNSVNG